MKTKKIKPRKRGVNPKELTSCESTFVLALLATKDWNITKAVKEAYPNSRNPAQYGTKLMSRPRIQAILGRLRYESQQEFKVEAGKILWHISACATRNGKDYVDEDGRLLLNSQNINDLPDEVTAAIDGIEQEEKRYTTADGVEVIEIKTKIKLVSKAAALDMAAKHKGLFADIKVDAKVSLDFDGLYQDHSHLIEDDPIEQRLLKEEGK